MTVAQLKLSRGREEPWQRLAMGGTDPHGTTLGVNSYFLTRDGKPFFLVSGEFHYARYPATEWETELLKIQAGGVNTVACYVFWNYHETHKGKFDWRGEKNLRHFIELCARHELYYVLRIGPFVHGEWRNGGLPDWLYGEPLQVRANDPRYLAYVERFYTEIEAQVRGLLFADGGPIIAVQLENEYMHAGAPWETNPFGETEWITAGREGVAHLQTLKQLAERIGLCAPYTFVTAWGGAPILEDESLPVYSEYAYPTWIDEPSPSFAFLFQDRHAYPVTEPTHRVPNAYPFIMAEQQGGIQVRYNNRPIVPARSTEAMALVNIGSGCNALGYYMYHGGTTPHGFAERLHPQVSYDFQAPLGEYGQARENYRSLKLLHQFLEAYGETLAPMQTCLPTTGLALTPNDLAAPRWSARTDGTAGFLFVNNFQDHQERDALENVRFTLETAGGTLTIPDTAGGALTIVPGVCFILPFEQSLHGARLVYATVQPLTHLITSNAAHYFYFAPEGITPHYCFDAATCSGVGGDMEHCETREGRLYIEPQKGATRCITLTAPDGTRVLITTLKREQAEHTWRGRAWNAERVIVSPAPLTFEQGGVTVRTLDTCDLTVTVFPSTSSSELVYSEIPIRVPARRIDLAIESCGHGKYLLQFPRDLWHNVSDVLLRIEYQGDMAMAFLDGELVADHFCNGLPWEIGLKRFAPLLDKGLVLAFYPLRHGVVKNVSSASAARFEFQGDEKLQIDSIVALPEYSISLP